MGNAFLLSTAWAKIKLDLFWLRGRSCEVCGRDKNIHVHHLTYDRYGGDEEPEDLIILCARCHMIEHGIIKDRPRRKTRKKKEAKSLSKNKLAAMINEARERGYSVTHLVSQGMEMVSNKSIERFKKANNIKQRVG